MVDLGNINRPVQFPDPTAFLQLLQQREQLQLQRQELEFRRMQERFDQEADLANRDSRIRLITAQAAAAEQDVQLKTEQTEALNNFNALIGAMGEAIGPDKSVSNLARVAGGFGNIVSKVSSKLGRATVRGLGTGGVAGALGAPITGTLDSNIADGDLDSGAAVLGQNEFSEALSPFVTDEMKSAARTLGKRSLTNFKTLLGAIPGPKYIMERMNADNVPEMLGQLREMQVRVAGELQRLDHPIYNHPDLDPERTEAVFLTAEKHRELAKKEEVIAAGQEVLSGGHGVVTAQQREGVTDILKQDVKNLMSSMNPGLAVVRLGDHLKAARIWPSDIVGEVFNTAATANEPMSQYRAALLFEELKKRYEPIEQNAFLKEIGKYGDGLLYEKLKTMTGLRNSMLEVERAAFASSGPQAAPPAGPGGALASTIAGYGPAIEYVTQLSASADAAMRAGQEMREAARTENIVDPEAKDLPTDPVSLNRVLAFQHMERLDVLDELDIKVAPTEMIDEFYTVMMRYPDIPPESQADFARAEILNNWHEDWLVPDGSVNRTHPIHIAQSQGSNVDLGLARQVARYQLQTELLDGILTKDGLPANVRLEDVRAVPFVDGDGIGYWVKDRNPDPVTKELRTYGKWRPDYSDEALGVVWTETRPRTGKSVFEHEPLWWRLNRHLGDATPDKQAKAARQNLEELENLRRRRAYEQERATAKGQLRPISGKVP